MTNKIALKAKVLGGLAAFVAVLFLVNSSVFASNGVDINANISEVLSVSLATPQTWATGNIGDFMRNKISLNVFSNNGNGFTASMTTKTTNSSLVNTTSPLFSIPTLSQDYTRSNFPADFWGYSTDDTDGGNGSSTYGKISASNETPNILFYSNVANSTSRDIYFGMKASSSKASGTYASTVIFSVVSGVVPDSNNSVPAPVDPVIADSSANTTPTYYSGSNRTVYTTTQDGTITTEITEGNAVDSYTSPQGVNTTSNINGNELLVTGLAVTAGVIAAAGFFFFIFAKRKKDDDEEQK